MTDTMKLAVASVVRDIIVDDMLTRRGVRYARAKGPYSAPDRYRSGDPLWTWHYIVRSMDALDEAGLIEHHRGFWNPSGAGCQSVARATDQLRALVGPLIDPSECRGLAGTAEGIELRRRKGKKPIDYTDTIETRAMRHEVDQINGALGRLEVVHRGCKLEISPGRRVFHDAFECGGRFYFAGSSVQGMPSRARRELTFIVDGEPHAAVEVDYCTLHPVIAYQRSGAEIPHGDLYEIDGLSRRVVKLALNMLFNAGTRKKAKGALLHEARTDSQLIREFGGADLEVVVDRVLEAVIRKHSRIKSAFCSDLGVRFQRLDSDMAMSVMTRMIEKTGRCPLPVHDSFLVAEIDVAVLRRTMLGVAQEHGLTLDLRESRAVRTTVEDLKTRKSPLVPRGDSGIRDRTVQRVRSCAFHPTPLPLEVTGPDLGVLELARLVLRTLLSWTCPVTPSWDGRRRLRPSISLPAPVVLRHTGRMAGRSSAHGPPYWSNRIRLITQARQLDGRRVSGPRWKPTELVEGELSDMCSALVLARA